MNTRPEKLILFDIDGTLISAGGAGTRSMNMAFIELFGIRDAFENIPMAGKTDIQIMKEGLKLHGFSCNGNVEKMLSMYLTHLRTEIDNPMKSLKPGILNALDHLKKEGMALGLLTGNLEKGARIKLGIFGIEDYFLAGAFGSDHEDRDKLLPIAIEKFKRMNFDFTPHTCIVVGDTPRDVQCAKIHGAHCIAVATGPYAKEELLMTDADIVIDSFKETDKYMNFISALA
jgi:phosphoglycolate phosphatase-like HAD superfamily hydrolase